jgi:hypothetical protein
VSNLADLPPIERMTPGQFAAALADPMYRLSNLYWIKTKSESEDDGDEGLVVRFKPNRYQRRLLRKLHHRNIILKARQLGFTTLIQILFLDYALFTPNVRCGVIAHTDDAALKVFKKIKFAYDRLPDVLKATVPLVTCNAHEMELANGSVLTVGTSMRSDTIHYLHISEFGKICAKFPHRAEEVITGTIPAVPNTGVIFIESTAEGRDGAFYKMSQRAEALALAGKELTPKEYRFHFFPWHDAEEYQIDPAGVIISDKDHEYFNLLEAKLGKDITPAQRAWWISTRDNDFAGEESKMWQEYPSTPEEAFQQSTAGTYYAVQIARARKEKRFTKVAHMPGFPVNTFWDIGHGDGTAIWFHQHIGQRHHFIKFIVGWGEPYSYFVKEMQKLDYVWGTHYLPHDGNHVRQGELENLSPKQMLEKLGLRNIEIVPVVAELQHGITAVRDAFSGYWFDEEGCKEGIAHIEMYKKKWNTTTQTFTDQPLKDIHTEAADALRQHAQGFHAAQQPGAWKRKSTSWKAS